MFNETEKVGLVCDGAGDLPRELIEKYKISIVPLRVDFGQMKDIPGNTYQKIREAERRGIKSFVKTSQPSPGDFLSAFKEKLKRFEKIVCITITSKLSGTFNSAQQARGFLEEKFRNKIAIIDSLNGSCGEGLLILKATDLIEKGLKMEEILENLRKTVSKIYLIAMLGDPKWLGASGRVPRFVVSWLKGMQKIGLRPLIAIKRGRIIPIGIKRGAKDMATALFREFESRISKIKDKKIKVAITHADNLGEAQKLKEMIEGIKNTEVVFMNLICNVLGGVAGPGTIALSWQENS